MAKKTSEYEPRQRKINSDIKSGEFSSSYLIYGDEGYLRSQNRNELKKAMLGSGDSMNLNTYSGSSISPGEIIDMAETMPFFADRRIIIVEESGFFKHGCKELAAYIRKQVDTVNFIFCETEVDKRTDMFKAVNTCGFSIDCETQPEARLALWINMKLKTDGMSMEPATTAFFLGRVGSDMFNIAGELEKLVSYCKGRKIITRQDVDAVCANWITGRIFDMTDAIVAGNRGHALDLYYDLLALKEPAIKILFMITRQYNIMLQIKEMAESGTGMAQMMSEMKMPSFVISKYLGWARKYTAAQIKNSLYRCIECDASVKSGKYDQNIGVEMLIVSV